MDKRNIQISKPLERDLDYPGQHLQNTNQRDLDVSRLKHPQVGDNASSSAPLPPESTFSYTEYSQFRRAHDSGRSSTPSPEVAPLQRHKDGFQDTNENSGHPSDEELKKARFATMKEQYLKRFDYTETYLSRNFPKHQLVANEILATRGPLPSDFYSGPYKYTNKHMQAPETLQASTSRTEQPLVRTNNNRERPRNTRPARVEQASVLPPDTSVADTKKKTTSLKKFFGSILSRAKKDKDIISYDRTKERAFESYLQERLENPFSYTSKDMQGILKEPETDRPTARPKQQRNVLRKRRGPDGQPRRSAMPASQEMYTRQPLASDNWQTYEQQYLPPRAQERYSRRPLTPLIEETDIQQSLTPRSQAMDARTEVRQPESGNALELDLGEPAWRSSFGMNTPDRLRAQRPGENTIPGSEQRNLHQEPTTGAETPLQPNRSSAFAQYNAFTQYRELINEQAAQTKQKRTRWPRLTNRNQ